MKKIFIVGIVLSVFVSAQNSDFEHDDGIESGNSTFEKMKIKNRSKKEYDDKIYKYIKGDYTVENNTIELATIELDDRVRNQDIEINVHVEDLEVIGDEYQDSIGIKRNRYKNFVQHDERGEAFFEEENEMDINALESQVRVNDRRREKIVDEDISELETIDLRGKRKIKEVNVFIEETRIRVDK